MKKSLKFSLLALVMAGAVACSDDDNDDDTQNQPPSNAELIKGEWTGTSWERIQTNSENDSIIGQEMDEDFMEVWTFAEEGAFERVNDVDTTTGTYTLDGTMLSTVVDEDTTDYEVADLTEADLVLEIHSADSTTTTKENWTFEKQ